MDLIFALASFVALGGALGLGWQAGDRDDRRMIALIAVAAVATSLAYAYLPLPVARGAICAFDALLLVIIGRFALTSDRHWPVWFAGTLTPVVMFDIAAAVLPTEDVLRYDLFSGMWSIVGAGTLLMGLWADRRSGMRR